MGNVTPYATDGGKHYRVCYRLPDGSQTDKRGFKTTREVEQFLVSVEVTKTRGEFVPASQSESSLGERAGRTAQQYDQKKEWARRGSNSRPAD
jgi:hypothetical protein